MQAHCTIEAVRRFNQLALGDPVLPTHIADYVTSLHKLVKWVGIPNDQKATQEETNAKTRED